MAGVPACSWFSGMPLKTVWALTSSVTETPSGRWIVIDDAETALTLPRSKVAVDGALQDSGLPAGGGRRRRPGGGGLGHRDRRVRRLVLGVGDPGGGQAGDDDRSDDDAATHGSSLELGVPVLPPG